MGLGRGGEVGNLSLVGCASYGCASVKIFYPPSLNIKPFELPFCFGRKPGFNFYFLLKLQLGFILNCVAWH